MATITAAMVKELREVTGAAMMDCKKALTECDGNQEDAQEFLRKKGQAIAAKKSSRETKEGAIAVQKDGKKTALVKIACETDFVAINDQFKEFISLLAKEALEVGTDGFVEKTSSNGSIKEMFVNAIAKMGENMAFLDGQDWEAGENAEIGSYVHSNGKIGVMVEITMDKVVDAAKVQNLARDISMHIAASPVEAIKETDLDPAVLEKEKNFLMDQARESGKPENIIEKMVIGRLQKYKKEICLLDQNFVKNPELTIEQLLKQTGNELGAQLDVSRFYKTQF